MLTARAPLMFGLTDATSKVWPLAQTIETDTSIDQGRGMSKNLSTPWAARAFSYYISCFGKPLSFSCWL